MPRRGRSAARHAPPVCTVAGMSPNPTPPAPHLFEATHVTAVMPQQGGDHTVFHDLSFHVDAGEVVDITGPSGAGKSTLLTAFARLNEDSTGIFTLDG